MFLPAAATICAFSRPLQLSQAISIVINTVFLARTDVSILPSDRWADDVGYYSYLSMLRTAELHNNPW